MRIEGSCLHESTEIKLYFEVESDKRNPEKWQLSVRDGLGHVVESQTIAASPWAELGLAVDRALTASGNTATLRTRRYKGMD